jgi:anti-anti-sigma factor
MVVDQVDERTVVRFTAGPVLTGEKAEAVSEQLFHLVDDLQRRRLVLDFASVDSLTSLMIGKLVTLNKRLRDAGGRLVLCNVKPDLRGVFEVTGLTRLLAIYPDEQAALAHV